MADDAWYKEILHLKVTVVILNWRATCCDKPPYPASMFDYNFPAGDYVNTGVDTNKTISNIEPGSVFKGLSISREVSRSKLPLICFE